MDSVVVAAAVDVEAADSVVALEEVADETATVEVSVAAVLHAEVEVVVAAAAAVAVADLRQEVIKISQIFIVLRYQ